MLYTRHLARLAVCSLALPLASAQVVHNISGPTVQVYTGLQSAIDSANPNDVLLFETGASGGLNITKPLTIMGMPGATLTMASSVSISNIAAGERLVLSGVKVFSQSSSSGPGPDTLRILNCDGLVYLQDCEFIGDSNYYFHLGCTYALDGSRGAYIQFSNQVTFSNCILAGGSGIDTDDFCVPAGDGGLGIYTNVSTVALYDCVLVGGTDGHGYGWSRSGYFGGTTVFASGSQVAEGLYVPGGSTIHHRDLFFGGTGAITGGGVNVALPGNARSLLADTIRSFASPGHVDLYGDALDKTWILNSYDPKFRWLSPWGVQLVEVVLPLPMTSGVVPGNGHLSAALDFSSLAAPTQPSPVGLQGFVIGSNSRWLTGVRHTLPLDPASGPDCNNNGINDYLDLFTSTSQDADRNLVPDECP